MDEERDRTEGAGNMIVIQRDSKAIVTGSSGKLGTAIVDQLKIAGFSVGIPTRGDLYLKASTPQVRNRFEHFADVLVNCAGKLGPIGSFISSDWDEWMDTIEVDFMLAVRLCRMVLPGMIARGYGKIINISGGGATKGMPNFSAYASAKTALVRFTETLAAEVEQYHIDVNAVSPGPMYSAITEQIIAAGKENAGLEAYDEACQTKDYNRTPEEAARLVAFLASHESDGITGRLISAVHDPWRSLRAGHLTRDQYTLRRKV